SLVQLWRSECRPRGMSAGFSSSGLPPSVLWVASRGSVRKTASGLPGACVTNDVIISVLCFDSAARASARMWDAKFSQRLCHFPSRNVKWTEWHVSRRSKSGLPRKETLVLGLRVDWGLWAAGLLFTGAGMATAGDPIPEAPKRESALIGLTTSSEPAAHLSRDGHGEAEHEAGEHHEQPSDLSPCDFFRTGWAEPFEERPSEGRAPRFKLFKSRQGFLERIAVGGYTYTNGVDAGNFNEHELAAGLEWAFNRRFAFEVEPFYTWQRPSCEQGRHADGLR